MSSSDKTLFGQFGMQFRRHVARCAYVLLFVVWFSLVGWKAVVSGCGLMTISVFIDGPVDAGFVCGAGQINAEDCQEPCSKLL